MKKLDLGIENEVLSLVSTESAPLKILENLCSSNVFRRYKKKTLT